MNSNTTENNVAYTFIGFAEYKGGHSHLYDGNDSERATGTTAEVIAYLEQTKAQVPASEESLQWQGGNGMWYSGDNARKAIDAEIAELRDGSHPCFLVE